MQEPIVAQHFVLRPRILLERDHPLMPRRALMQGLASYWRHERAGHAQGWLGK
jgi:hypothetical protein